MAQHGSRTVSRHFAFAVVCIVMAAQLSFGQVVAGQTAAMSGVASTALSAYDVVSVKPVHPERILSMGAQETPDGINAETVTVAMLVQNAYSSAENLPIDDAVTGLPDWAKADYFSVQAKMNSDQVAAFAKLSKAEQRASRQAMLQALLGDRFKLKVHRETRQVLAYELVVAKGGPKMTEGATDDPGAPMGPNGKPMRSFLQFHSSKPGTLVITGNGCSMEQLASALTHNSGLNHKLTDKTGLTGKYRFTLTFAFSQGVGPVPAGGPTDAAVPDDTPSIFDALEDQLGLKLQRGTGTVDVVIVDHVERPTPN